MLSAKASADWHHLLLAGRCRRPGGRRVVVPAPRQSFASARGPSRQLLAAESSRAGPQPQEPLGRADDAQPCQLARCGRSIRSRSPHGSQDARIRSEWLLGPHRPCDLRLPGERQRDRWPRVVRSHGPLAGAHHCRPAALQLPPHGLVAWHSSRADGVPDGRDRARDSGRARRRRPRVLWPGNQPHFDFMDHSDRLKGMP